MIDRNPKPGEYYRLPEGSVERVAHEHRPGVWTMETGRLVADEVLLKRSERVKVVPDPHPEPKVWWVNVYADRGSAYCGPLQASRTEADNTKYGDDRIACVRVTEGQFDAD